jgi:hypothetical protein
MVQDFNCVMMRVSGCKNHYEFVLGAGAKAKTMTNNLPILSVLGLGIFISVLTPVNYQERAAIYYLFSMFQTGFYCLTCKKNDIIPKIDPIRVKIKAGQNILTCHLASLLSFKVF